MSIEPYVSNYANSFPADIRLVQLHGFIRANSKLGGVSVPLANQVLPNRKEWTPQARQLSQMEHALLEGPDKKQCSWEDYQYRTVRHLMLRVAFGRLFEHNLCGKYYTWASVSCYKDPIMMIHKKCLITCYRGRSSEGVVSLTYGHLDFF